MTLQEILRTHTREARDVLQEYENRIREQGRLRRAELSQLEGLQEIINSKQRDANECHGIIQDAQAKIRDLDKQIEDLRQHRDDLADQTQAASLQLASAELEIEQVRREWKDGKARVDSFDHQVKKFVDQRDRARKRLAVSLRTAFRTHLDELELQLTRTLSSLEERVKRATIRERFERARHEDAHVMDLYEAMVELKNLLKMSNVPGIRSRLGEQLQAIEGQIETLFPGALSSDLDDDSGSQVVEISYSQDGENRVRFFLPISVNTWNAIAVGDRGPAVSNALRLVWGLAKALDVDAADAQLQVVQDWVLLHAGADSVVKSPELPITLGPSGVAFVLARLPHEVDEALRQ